MQKTTTSTISHRFHLKSLLPPSPTLRGLLTTIHNHYQPSTLPHSIIFQPPSIILQPSLIQSPHTPTAHNTHTIHHPSNFHLLPFILIKYHSSAHTTQPLTATLQHPFPTLHYHPPPSTIHPSLTQFQTTLYKPSNPPFSTTSQSTHTPPTIHPQPIHYPPTTRSLPTHYSPTTNPQPTHYSPTTHPLPTHNPLTTHSPTSFFVEHHQAVC